MAFTVSASQKQPCACGWECSTHEGMGLVSQLQTAQAGQGSLWGHVTQAASWGMNQTGTQWGRGHRRGWLFSALTYRHSSRQVTKQQKALLGPQPQADVLRTSMGPAAQGTAPVGAASRERPRRGVGRLSLRKPGGRRQGKVTLDAKVDTWPASLPHSAAVAARCARYPDLPQEHMGTKASASPHGCNKTFHVWPLAWTGDPTAFQKLVGSHPIR